MRGSAYDILCWFGDVCKTEWKYEVSASVSGDCEKLFVSRLDTALTIYEFTLVPPQQIFQLCSIILRKGSVFDL